MMEQYYWAALAALLGYGAPQQLKHLLACFGTAEQAFTASQNELSRPGLLTPALLRHWQQGWQADLPDRIYEYCETHGVHILTLLDAQYPERLRQLSDPPPVLYVKGTLPDLDNALAMVGSRKATPYGSGNAEKFAGYLAKHGIPIISGGAYGIDAASHKGALEGGGATVAVLGGGFEHLYPARHVRLFDRICTAGALVTEFAPWVESLALHFPLRNRIIVGLSKAVLVVEAALKSGAMITAHVAVEENRDVYAMPGLITSPVSQGTHRLIQEGAHLVTSPQEVLHLLQPEKAEQPEEIEQQALFTEKDSLSYTGSLPGKVYDWLTRQAEPQSLETVAEQFPHSLAELTTALLELELTNKVRKGPADKYYVI